MQELLINRCHPMQNNKAIKGLHTHAVQKIQLSGWGFMANTALGYASCCSTSPLALYFVYSTRGCALTSICGLNICHLKTGGQWSHGAWYWIYFYTLTSNW